MDGTQYDPGPSNLSRCMRAADRKAIMQSIVMTVAMIGAVLLAAAFFPWILEPGESWLAYAATMQ